MRRDIKKRLEKALTTLQEPGGSTIRSIIKVINKDSPILSLRKVLEALQDGLNEGFLCMYNGRFKLKQQIKGYPRDRSLGDESFAKKDDMEATSDVAAAESEADSEDESSGDVKLEREVFGIQNCPTMKKKKRSGRPRKRKIMYPKKSQKCLKKKGSRRKKGKRKRKRSRKLDCSNNSEKIGCNSVLEVVPQSEKKSGGSRQAADKSADMKRSRGPRCTSMKKDVRMPSKVHIPCMPAPVPQRNSTFNELLRQSPEPVNGPLFDSFLFSSEGLGFFGAR